MDPARLAEIEAAWPIPEGRSTGTWAEIGPAVVIHELIAEIRRLTDEMALKDKLMVSMKRTYDDVLSAEGQRFNAQWIAARVAERDAEIQRLTKELEQWTKRV